MIDDSLNQPNFPRPTAVTVVTWALVAYGLIQLLGSIALAWITTREFSPLAVAPGFVVGLIMMLFYWACAFGYWKGHKWSVVVFGLHLIPSLMFAIVGGGLIALIIPGVVFISMFNQWSNGKLDHPFTGGQPVHFNWKAIGITCGVIALLAASAALMVYALPWVSPKTTIALKSGGTAQAQPADLKTAVDILSVRSQKLGYRYRGVSFGLDKQGQIVGRVPQQVDTRALAGIYQTGLLELVELDQTMLNEGTLIRTDYNIGALPEGEGQIFHTILTNRDFQDASVQTDPLGQVEVEFTLNEKGGRIFEDFTREHIGSYLAIVYDKKILSVPRVMSTIPGGKAVIQSNFTREEAENLAAVLVTPPLPFPLEPNQQ